MTLGERARHGEDAVTRNKLTVSEVRAIRRELFDGDVSQTDLARRYNVSRGTISDIFRRRTWSWIR
jgi:DNA-binding transcriptional regulator YiaG